MASWRFYVYELVDPRGGITFYVGKGQKDRILAHEDEARKGVCSEKCSRINEIWSEQVLRVAFSTMFPNVFAELQKSRADLERVADKVGAYGAELVYGGA